MIPRVSGGQPLLAAVLFQAIAPGRGSLQDLPPHQERTRLRKVNPALKREPWS
jgi:hypothetical protein